MPDVTGDKWPCVCAYCFSKPTHVWVVMTERIMIQEDGTFRGDEDPNVVQYGYPLFFRKGKPDAWVSKGRFGPDWSDDITHALHFGGEETTLRACVEAALFHPTLIGKLRAIPFRIR